MSSYQQKAASVCSALLDLVYLELHQCGSLRRAILLICLEFVWTKLMVRDSMVLRRNMMCLAG